MLAEIKTPLRYAPSLRFWLRYGVDVEKTEQKPIQEDARKCTLMFKTFNDVKLYCDKYGFRKTSVPGIPKMLLKHNKTRVIVDFFKVRDQSVIDYRTNLFSSDKYLYLFVVANEDNTKFKSDISFHFKKHGWLEKRGQELNTNMWPSERWFKDKIEKEDVYKEFQFEYNKPFMGYIPDLISIKYRVIIEVDGSVHNLPKIQSADYGKAVIYNKKGFSVIRVKHNDTDSYNECIEWLNRRLNGQAKRDANDIEKIRDKMARRFIKRVNHDN